MLYWFGLIKLAGLCSGQILGRLGYPDFTATFPLVDPVGHQEGQFSMHGVKACEQEEQPVARCTAAKSSVIWAILLELADCAALFLAKPQPTAVALRCTPISVFTKAWVRRSRSSISAFLAISCRAADSHRSAGFATCTLTSFHSILSPFCRMLRVYFL